MSQFKFAKVFVFLLSIFFISISTSSVQVSSAVVAQLVGNSGEPSNEFQMTANDFNRDSEGDENSNGDDLAINNTFQDSIDSDMDDLINASKRSSNKKAKKNVPRTRDIRRHQAAKWDIGFGKRSYFNPKSIMEVLYGKRNSKASANIKPFGRKQHWDIQFGKRILDELDE